MSRLVFAVALLTSAAVFSPFAQSRAEDAPWNVILISMDTLRADRLGCYGHDRPTSPAMDALAARGVLFQNVISEASWTLPAHMTLFTGLFPTSHGVTLAERQLPEAIPTFAERLQERGYRTVAITDGGMVDGRFGFARGFDSYDDKRKELRLTLYRAQKFLDDASPAEPYFLFLHTYEVHCPYHPREEYARRFRTRPPADQLETEEKCGNTFFNNLPRTPGQNAFLSDQYDAGVRAADDLLGAFFADLQVRGTFENTIVVLLSDHGEELGEHGRIGHERTLYLESLQVPWILVAPGVEPAVVREPVGLIDFLPTLCELLGLEGPSGSGRSLVSIWREGAGAPGSSRPRFSELDRHVRLRSVIDEDRHLIVDLDGGAVRFYDLSADPSERKTLDVNEAAPWEVRLRQHFDTLPRVEAEATELPPELVRELEALGYVR